jgi:hypothetical protein
MLTTIDLLISGAQEEEAAGNGDLLTSFVKGQLFRGEPLLLQNGRRGGYGEKLLEEMDKVGRVSEKVALMIRDAKSDTNHKGAKLL